MVCCTDTRIIVVQRWLNRNRCFAAGPVVLLSSFCKPCLPALAASSLSIAHCLLLLGFFFPHGKETTKHRLLFLAGFGQNKTLVQLHDFFAKRQSHSKAFRLLIKPREQVKDLFAVLRRKADTRIGKTDLEVIGVLVFFFHHPKGIGLHHRSAHHHLRLR